jgi:homoserine dehydrogenase
LRILQRNSEELARRLGKRVVVGQIGARSGVSPDLDVTGIAITRDVFEVAKNPEIHILVELIGGVEAARELVLAAIAAGKHVVTANKALIAVHGNEIFQVARERGVVVAYEAAVAGGIPVIKAIREGLVANRIHAIAGIINGTGNFILSEMREKGRDFADVLQEAQQLGYAEADPTFDVEGIDAAHKLTILAAIAFGIPLRFDKTYTEGISRVTPEDVQFAGELGYRIKHLGIARAGKEGIELRVHPTLVPESHLLASVEGVMNAVLVDADAVGQTLYYGAGAGAEPTASAVVADIADLVRLLEAPAAAVAPLGYQVPAPETLPVLAADAFHSAYYLHLQAVDHAGVLSQLTGALSEHGISIEALVQKEVKAGEQVASIIMVTESVKEDRMNAAIAQLEALASVAGSVVRIRLAHLDQRP